MLDTIKGAVKKKFLWTPHANQGFEILKKKIAKLPTLVLQNFDKLFQVECDASNVALGAVLGQRRNKVFHSIYYASKTLQGAQLNYTMT